jgi:hypothetical protein
MTVGQFADIVLTLIQEEMDESIDEPWAVPADQTTTASRFRHERIGDALHVTEIVTGDRFVIECRSEQ